MTNALFFSFRHGCLALRPYPPPRPKVNLPLSSPLVKTPHLKDFTVLIPPFHLPRQKPLFPPNPWLALKSILKVFLFLVLFPTSEVLLILFGEVFSSTSTFLFPPWSYCKFFSFSCLLDDTATTTRFSPEVAVFFLGNLSDPLCDGVWFGFFGFGPFPTVAPCQSF